MKKIIISVSFALSLLVMGVAGMPVSTHADTSGATTPTSGMTTPTSGATTPTSGLTNPLTSSSLEDLVNKIIQLLVRVGGIFLTFMLIYTGFKFITARGNEEKVSSARTALLWTVVGGLLLVGAEGISLAIQGIIAAL